MLQLSLALKLKSPRGFAIWAYRGHRGRDGLGRALSIEQLQIMPDIIRAGELSWGPRGGLVGRERRGSRIHMARSVAYDGNEILELTLTRSVCHKLD